MSPSQLRKGDVYYQGGKTYQAFDDAIVGKCSKNGTHILEGPVGGMKGNAKPNPVCYDPCIEVTKKQ